MIEKITNEQIYELLQSQDKRMDMFLEMLKEQNRRTARIEDRVDAIYDTRDKVQVSFTRSWAGASMFVAVLVAFLGTLAGKIMFS